MKKFDCEYDGLYVHFKCDKCSGAESAMDDSVDGYRVYFPFMCNCYPEGVLIRQVGKKDAN